MAADPTRRSEPPPFANLLACVAFAPWPGSAHGARCDARESLAASFPCGWSAIYSDGSCDVPVEQRVEDTCHTPTYHSGHGLVLQANWGESQSLEANWRDKN
jgi:hypothetical protein